MEGLIWNCWGWQPLKDPARSTEWVKVMQMKWSHYILKWVKWLCTALNSHILLFHSHSGIMQVPICSHLFPWVPEEIKTDSNFSLSLPVPIPHPHLPLLPTFPLFFLPFFVDTDNSKVFNLFPWRLFKQKHSFWEYENHKIREKKRLVFEHGCSTVETTVMGLKNFFLPTPSHIYWMLRSCQRINECFSYINSFFFF